MDQESGIELLPWHRPYWTSLLAYIHSGRLPQGLLISGASGLGKNRLAKRFAHTLLCENKRKTEFPCGRCSPCTLMAAGSHPDLIIIEPEDDRKGILVDHIRGVISRLSVATHFGGNRVVLIHKAHRMNRAAANSFLKTLEEPTDRTVIILVADTLAPLPLTISSRCQRLHMALPDKKAALEWLGSQNLAEDPEILLGMARGAPLLALSLADEQAIKKRRLVLDLLIQLAEDSCDPVFASEKCSEIPEEWVADLLTTWVVDMIRMGYYPAIPYLFNPDLRDTLQGLVQGLNLKQLFGFLSTLFNAKQRLLTQANRPLFLEDLFIEWQRVTEHT